jgi:hypothetical protein
VVWSVLIEYSSYALYLGGDAQLCWALGSWGDLCFFYNSVRCEDETRQSSKEWWQALLSEAGSVRGR